MYIISALLLLFYIDEVLSCAATSTTTTPSSTLCDECTANDITFILTGQGATNFSPPTGTQSMNAAGCNQLTLTCLPGPNGESTIDNGSDTGTVTFCETFGTCMVVLTCNAMGQWTFTDNGVTIVVTQIRCAAQ